jgi:hypothetical protein
VAAFFACRAHKVPPIAIHLLARRDRSTRRDIALRHGMPGFVDRVTIDGKTQNIVWMPSLFPLRGATYEPEEGGGWSNL